MLLVAKFRFFWSHILHFSLKLIVCIFSKVHSCWINFLYHNNIEAVSDMEVNGLRTFTHEQRSGRFSTRHAFTTATNPDYSGDRWCSRMQQTEAGSDVSIPFQGSCLQNPDTDSYHHKLSWHLRLCHLCVCHHIFKWRYLFSFSLMTLMTQTRLSLGYSHSHMHLLWENTEDLQSFIACLKAASQSHILRILYCAMFASKFLCQQSSLLARNCHRLSISGIVQNQQQDVNYATRACTFESACMIQIKWGHTRKHCSPVLLNLLGEDLATKVRIWCVNITINDFGPRNFDPTEIAQDNLFSIACVRVPVCVFPL